VSGNKKGGLRAAFFVAVGARPETYLGAAAFFWKVEFPLDQRYLPHHR